ncbi:MAG TPA: M4 family metallopeptidase, partial [Bacteroidia bacterium]|nr:M4 family metallopeptidase [Bacteroidia bacterium]
NCASPGKPDDFRLCFKIHIYSTIPTDTYDLYADAQSGKIVSKNQIATTSCFHSNNDGKKEDNDKPEIAAEETSKVSLAPVDEQGCAQPCVQGTANLDYYGSQYIYTDKFLYALVNCTHRTKNTCTSTFLYVTKNNGNDYRDNTNNWTTGSDKPGTTSLWCLERTHDFYRYTYGRNSFNGASAQVNLYAESDAGNAYWTGSDLKIGTAGGSFTDDLTTLDIIGHEFTHGVTQYEAALIYQGESGALNESFSDIFGKMVDYYTKSNYSTGRPFTYILAEECTNGGLRSMSNPNSKNQPDTYGGSYWVSPSSSADNGGVHTNSGVQNYWFYLLAEGGSGTNDLGNTFCVAPIGKDKAASIAYRTLSVYLTSSSNYANARFFSIQSAIDLYGAGSNEVAQVTAAWYAVGIGSNYSGNINITNHTATGIENYKFNAAVSVSNFTAQSGSRVTITSSRAIEMTGVVKGQSGCMFHAYIAPGCVGGAIVAESGDNAIRNGNKEQTTGTASGNIEGATVEDAILIQNPNDGNFKIVVNTGTKNGRVKDITIQDIFGNIVWKEATSKTVYDVDIASKASGLYIVRFSDDAGKITTKKFIKQ